jgi:hypothetical protein
MFISTKIIITAGIAMLLLVNPVFSCDYTDNGAAPIAATSLSDTAIAAFDVSLTTTNVPEMGPTVECFFEINANEPVCAK